MTLAIPRARGSARTPTFLLTLCLCLAAVHLASDCSKSTSTDEAAAPGSPLGTGSAVAFPFARGDGGQAANDAQQQASLAPDLPPSIAALGDEPIAHALYRLGARARIGDAQAALSAFEIADFCAHAQDDSQRRLCDGVTPALLGERYQNLQRAAEGKVAGAAVRLLDAAEQEGVRSPVDWSDRAIELARRDAAAGDLDALVTMTKLYQFGGSVDADQQQALTFAIATEGRMVAGGAESSSPGEIALERLLVFTLESQLGPERSDAAHQAAASLLAAAPPPTPGS